MTQRTPKEVYKYIMVNHPYQSSRKMAEELGINIWDVNTKVGQMRKAGIVLPRKQRKGSAVKEIIEELKRELGIN